MKEGIRKREDIKWCTHQGGPSSSAFQKPLSFISNVESAAVKFSVDDVIFRDPDTFVARGKFINIMTSGSLFYETIIRETRY